MNELTIGVMLMAGLLTLLDWRKGLVICIFIGLAQDPLRKLAPNQPIYYVILVGVIFGIAWVRAALMRVPLGPSVIHGWQKSLKIPFSLFFALVAVQAMHSFARYGSAKMAAIGVLVWLAPVPAVVLAYQYAVRRGILAVRQWMLIYVLVALVPLSGVYLEYMGFDWRTLGEIGEGQIIYDVGTVLKAYSGFFRASEIAAWHTATIACFVFILSIGKRATVIRVALALALIAMLVSLGLLTGRRKMLIEITIFVSVYLFLVAWLQRGLARLAMIMLLTGAVGYIVIVGFVAPDTAPRGPVTATENAQRIEGYAARGQSVFGDLPARVNGVGVQPVMAAVDSFGWWGAGLGTGSQGTNEIAEANNINRWPAEGGLGKVAMELGVPGLFLVLWLLSAVAGHLHRQMAVMSKVAPQHARMAYGLTAFLVANAATFSVATQAYSDLFILLMLGWCMGFLLAMPVLALQGHRSKPRAKQTAWDFATTARDFFPTQPAGARRGPGQRPR
jgi:hypothetical protein